MADEVIYHRAPKTDECCEGTANVKEVENSDHGLFDYFGKKEEEKKCDKAEIVSKCKDEKKDEKKESLLEKLRQSDGSFSSSSDEECEDGEKSKKKKKKNKDLKEKAEEKKEEKEISKHKDDTCSPVEKCEEVVVPPPSHHHAPPPVSEVVVHPPEPSCEPEDKKGLIEKIKEKLPGGHKQVEEDCAAPPPPPPPPAVATHVDHYGEAESEHKEKKGILEKIKEKLPGYHSKSEEEKKEKKKEKQRD